MFIRIGGVPGVGKTTIIEAIQKAAEGRGFPVDRIKGADYLLDILGVKNYDELRRLPEAVREAARPEMYRRMYKDDAADAGVVRLRDAHYSLWEGEEGSFSYFPIFPEDRQQTAALVCICASPEIILERRMKDGGKRTDRAVSIVKIKEELRVELETCREQARSLGLEPIIINNDGRLDDSCRELVARSFPEAAYKSQLEQCFSSSFLGKERVI